MPCCSSNASITYMISKQFVQSITGLYFILPQPVDNFNFFVHPDFRNFIQIKNYVEREQGNSCITSFDRRPG